MKNKYTILFFLLVLGLFFQAKTFKPSELVLANQRENVAILSKQFSRFKQDLMNQKSKATLIEDFKKCRLTYKACERYLSYFDAATEKKVNAAPVTSLWYSHPYFEVFLPEGFQKLEEMLAEENLDYDALKTELQQLIFHFSFWEKNIQTIRLQDAHVFEAARYEIIRLICKDITGFDSPSLLHSLPETKAVLLALKQDFLIYQDSFSSTKEQKEFAAKTVNLLTQSISFLTKNTDFETFDRMTFIRDYLNPLYGVLYDFQVAMGIPTLDKKSDVNQAFHYQVKNIFDENFLNPYFYAESQVLKRNEKYEELGKILFFDPILSGNNERSCASCHAPEKAFTDGQRKSIALDFEGNVRRNSPMLLNVAYQKELFWDMRAPHLENQIAHVVVSDKEFGMDYKTLKEKLLHSSEYVALFEDLKNNKQKGGEAINLYDINLAIGMYVRTLKSFNSPFDQYMRGETNDYPQEAIRGFNLFMGKANCGSCHFAPVFNSTTPPYFRDSEAEVLGVPADKNYTSLDDDLGRFELFKAEFGEQLFLKGAFKTPTLRNIALTAPYMHNGVFDTLEEVMEFYNNGGGAGHGLDVPQQTLSSDSLHLTPTEISDIIFFMETLTDTSVSFSKPTQLPAFHSEAINKRKIGGVY